MVTGQQWVIKSSQQRPPLSSHHQTEEAEGKSIYLAPLINRFEHWSTQRPRRYSVVFCWLDFNFKGSHSHSISGPHLRSHSLARTSWNCFYSQDANFWIFLSELLFHLPRGREDSRWESKYKSPEGGSSWAGGTEGKPVQLVHGAQRKTSQRIDRDHITEGLTGHNKDFGCCYFQNFLHSHGELI